MNGNPLVNTKNKQALKNRREIVPSGFYFLWVSNRTEVVIMKKPIIIPKTLDDSH